VKLHRKGLSSIQLTFVFCCDRLPDIASHRIFCLRHLAVSIGWVSLSIQRRTEVKNGLMSCAFNSELRFCKRSNQQLTHCREQGEIATVSINVEE